MLSCIVNFLLCVICLISCDILLKSEHLADGTRTMNKFVKRKQLGGSETYSPLWYDPMLIDDCYQHFGRSHSLHLQGSLKKNKFLGEVVAVLKKLVG